MITLSNTNPATASTLPILNGNSPRAVRVVGIGGSTRLGSKTLVMLKTALARAEATGATAILADVRELDLPIYDADKPLDAYPSVLARLLDEIRAADAILIASPTYHGTISGAVKNVLDALNFLFDDQPRYLGGKPVGLLALGGPGAMNTTNALYHAARGLNGLAVPTVAIVSGSAVDAESGTITDTGAVRRLEAMVDEVLDLATRLRRPIPVPVAEWDTVTA